MTALNPLAPDPDEICPVCGQQTEDMRHVDVECFYQVNERAPHIKEREVLIAVDPEKSYFGLLRRYTGGEQQHADFERTGTTTTIHRRWEPMAQPELTVLPQNVYGIRCCKACRADFIGLFLRWSKGEFVQPEEADEERNIPVRENGHLVMLTRAEWDARQAAK